MGGDPVHTRNFSNPIGSEIFDAFGENDAADVNLTGKGCNFEVRNFQTARL